MAKKTMVTIKLKALGEVSELTGKKKMNQGDTLEVDSATAKAACADGRWVVVGQPTEVDGEEGQGAS